MDNNCCENTIRPLVPGRKGSLFGDTVYRAVSSAILYSLVWGHCAGHFTCRVVSAGVAPSDNILSK